MVIERWPDKSINVLNKSEQMGPRLLSGDGNVLFEKDWPDEKYYDRKTGKLNFTKEEQDAINAWIQLKEYQGKIDKDNNNLGLYNVNDIRRL